MSNHEKYMNRCLQLAVNGRGYTAPNPMVGSVIVHNDMIIGEGYHQKYGEKHAEVNAIEAVINKELLYESTLYVNLEPCSHFGKTPPCADFIIKHKIPRVIIGSIDTFSLVCGNGIQRLKENGIEVTVGVLEDECRALNKRFFFFHEQKRPYIILKWAQTLDGYIDIAPEKKQSSKGIWITNDICRTLVHKWRAEENAIMVGSTTVITDNPQLNIRYWPGTNPARIVIDKSLRLPPDVFFLDNTQNSIVFNSKKNETHKNTEYILIQFEEDILPQIFNHLYKRNIQSVIIEGGKILLDTFIKSGRWDEARIFIGTTSFGSGVKAPEFNYQPLKHEIWDGVNLLIYQNNKVF
ncbi:MAG: bifunctional diaminohydroxyphosphoribosylaminopyrimidine deaminase/5-amino-6-(5-phosphoribosylamino)uracil reductase RibD [Bacteroidales bacterium]